MTHIREAAAVVLIRETPWLEVFWVRRAAAMAFQGGFHAFPGGQLDPGEDPQTAAVREVFEEIGVRLEPDALASVGRWVTPAFSPRRFDTWFFLASCPPGQTANVMTAEHDHGEWIQPADAVAAWTNGTALVAPPVLHALRCLAEATSRDRRIADAHGRLEERLRELAAAVRPRAEYSVVHGELGLDHVLVDRDGSPVVIDFEELLSKYIFGKV